MIDKLLSTNPKICTYFVIIHLSLGVLSTFTPFLLVGWYYLVLLGSLKYLISPGKYPMQFMAIVSYLVSYDVIGRMANTSPYIPYELSKYLMLVLLIWGLLNVNNLGNYYLLIPVLLIPAFFIDISGERIFTDIVNSGIAPLNMGLAMVFFYRKKMTIQFLYALLLLILYTSMMVLSFAFFKTPDYDEIDYSLGANFQTAGGFGSNQVSTILGLGGFIVALFTVIGKRITIYKWVDVGLLFAFIFQGLLTFSRGGMIGMGLSVAVFVYYAGTLSLNTLRFSRSKIILYFTVTLLVSIIGFVIADNITGNNLSLRYKGETAGTLAGSKDKNLNTITSNRFDIFMGDLDLWYDNLFFGVGVGVSKYERKVVKDVVAHVELSRLLAEHGMLGLLVFIIWVLAYFKIRNQNRDGIAIATLHAIFILALYTSFHASMRTYVTPLLTGLAMVSIVNPVVSKKKNPTQSFNLKHAPDLYRQ